MLQICVGCIAATATAADAVPSTTANDDFSADASIDLFNSDDAAIATVEAATIAANVAGADSAVVASEATAPSFAIMLQINHAAFCSMPSPLQTKVSFEKNTL